MLKDYDKTILISMAVVLFCVLLFFIYTKRSKRVYSDVLCPVCGAHKVVLIKNDTVMGRQDYKCYSCKKKFYLTDAPE
jgi:predicted SprT family Zn-dependent metalloprotease